MRKFFYLFTALGFAFLPSVFSHAGNGIPGYTPSEEIVEAQKEFSDNKFGIFLHWGLYSMTAQGEWYMHNAGIDWREYEKLASVNIRGTLFSSLREIALMKRKPAGGSIINIGSVQQDTTVPGRTLYAMSKGAIHALTGELALEAGEFGIRVNNIAPGFIEVERLKASPSYNREGVAADIPLGRVGTPEDVGNLAVFLASAESGFISGDTIIADGGLHRRLARSRNTISRT